ncbi:MULTISPECIES: hypothetical protein [Sulfurisphaera]|uniref:Uncharacterized protein n=3 Tax=Sulfurisphaera TaxID=69655 RepID=F9VN67_SULTO|nr:MULTISPECIES: hypothetical protein [Sulfurisphaera]MBB5254401.1 hypothetical protein [Sulfurisphaera ohwakuensis]QGR16330.1 hypothetical protein D1869_03275 [Sulfurisphaera ohwakuensis]BAK54364.1 hypothetical protein STK_06815 [Sulfurisphaera tokodaii str. 7]HII74539.1 hypothetical protein [Sulfurisphaera tokodaii]
MDVKVIHEKIRSLVDVVDEEKHELRGRTKNVYVIQRYTRDNNSEIEEIYISSPQVNISLVINTRGISSVTYVKDGKIEGKNLNEEEIQKIIDDIIKILS